MPKLSHSQKLKIARKLISKDEIKAGVSLFLSRGWLLRKRDRANKVLRITSKAKINQVNQKVFGTIKFTDG